MDDLTDDGKLLRELYYQYYNSKNHTRYGIKPIPRFDGGVDSAGRKHKSIWNNLADKIISSGVPLAEYVEAVITDYDVQQPQDLANAAFIKHFREKVLDDPSCRIKWDAEEHTLLTEITIRHRPGRDIKDTIRRVVRDHTVEASPLVRYCFAWHNSCDHFVEDIQQEAFSQYKASKLRYDKYCSDRIPDHFREQE